MSCFEAKLLSLKVVIAPESTRAEILILDDEEAERVPRGEELGLRYWGERVISLPAAD